MGNKVSNEKIDAIREANKVEDVISEYMNIQKKGKNFVGICPFHADTAPSLTISPEKQIFKCFACGAGGNVFSFVQKYKSISFLETLKELAKRANIDVSEIKTFTKEIVYDKKTIRMFEINNEALNFFKYNIQNDDEAIKFAKSRGLTKEIIEKFDIGFAPSKTSLVNFLENKEFTKAEMIEMGLAKLNDNDKVLDQFFNRLIFPIKNENNKVIGFSGRVIDEKAMPKYLNSPETHIFKKTKLLFNIEKAKNDISFSKEVYILEGFMDVIALSKIGINNAVAIMGTAMTKENIDKLKKMTKKIVITFDNDNAGRAATIVTAIKLMKENIKCDVVNITTEHKDVDELVTNLKIEEVKAQLETRLTPVEFNIEVLSKLLNLKLVNNKTKFIEEINKIIRYENDDIAKQTYVTSISKLLDIDKQTLIKQLELTKIDKNVETYVANHAEIVQNVEYLDKIQHIYKQIEENLIKQCIKEKEVFKVIKKAKYDEWWSKTNKLMFMYIDVYYNKNNRIDFSEFLDSILDDGVKEKLINLIDIDFIDDNEITTYSNDEVEEWIEKLEENKELKQILIKLKAKS